MEKMAGGSSKNARPSLRTTICRTIGRGHRLRVDVERCLDLVAR